MMSASKMGRGAEDYYLRIAREDHYALGTEPPGRWMGDGAEALGLRGQVRPEDLRAMVRGYDPETGEALVQSAGRDSHQAGWDLTFSAPKSVSVLWGLGDEGTRQRVSACHGRAVAAALRYLEEEALLTRRGHGGHTLERAEGAFAVFEHGTSRQQDPHLHSHALFLNVGVRPDGTTGAIQSKPFYEHKMAAGALYRAELAAGLERDLGLRTERDGAFFRVVGIPKGVCDAFSKRRGEIERRMAERGERGAEAAEKAALHTRSKKRNVDRNALYSGWKEEGLAKGFDPESLPKAPAREVAETDLRQDARRTIDGALGSDSTFRKTDVVRRAMEAAQGTGAPSGKVRRAVDEELKDRRYVPLATQRHQAFTTRETLALERDVLKQASRSRQERGLPCDPSAVREIETRHGFFREERKEALRHLTLGEGGVKILDGLSGTGKTSLLEAAREAWEAEGFSVMGAAVTGKASRGLREASGIESRTVKRLLDGLATTTLDKGLHHAKMLLGAARGRKGYRLDAPSLDDNTVLVVDEASRVGTRQMSELMRHARESGAKLVLVGDSVGTPPVEGTSPFPAMKKLLGGAELERVVRQKEDWAREAVGEFAKGDVEKAFEAYAEKGLLFVDPDAKRVRERLVRDFLAVPEGETALALASTDAGKSELNRLIQAERMRRGELGLAFVTGEGGDRVREGDRVAFERNSKLFGVETGALGTVLGVRLSFGANDWEVRVDIDGKGVVTLPSKRYNSFALGYAASAHMAQGGETVDQAFVLLDGPTPLREAVYVQASRARGETCFYASETPEGWERKVAIMQGSRARPVDLEAHREIDAGGFDL